jgi:hypothetical protein
VPCRIGASRASVGATPKAYASSIGVASHSIGMVLERQLHWVELARSDISRLKSAALILLRSAISPPSRDGHTKKQTSHLVTTHTKSSINTLCHAKSKMHIINTIEFTYYRSRFRVNRYAEQNGSSQRSSRPSGNSVSACCPAMRLSESPRASHERCIDGRSLLDRHYIRLPGESPTLSHSIKTPAGFTSVMAQSWSGFNYINYRN